MSAARNQRPWECPTPAHIAARDPWETCGAIDELLSSGWRCALGVHRTTSGPTTHGVSWRWLLRLTGTQRQRSITVTNDIDERRNSRTDAVRDSVFAVALGAAEVDALTAFELLAVVTSARWELVSQAGLEASGRKTLGTLLKLLGLELTVAQVRPAGWRRA